MKSSKYASSSVKSEIRTITPIEAQEMIATMPEGGNRKLRQSHVEMLAGLIKDGNWLVTHNGICFDTEGRLIDGQHRMQAIITADAPVDIMVTQGILSEAMDAVDRGATRSIGDLLHLVHGIEGGSILTSACRIIGMEIEGYKAVPTVASTLEIYRKYQPGLDWVLKAMPARTNMNKTSYRAAIAIAAMVQPAPGKVGEFVTKYESGDHQSSRDPAWRLREFTVKLPLQKVQPTPPVLFDIACNALAAHLNGELISGISRTSKGSDFFRSALKEGGMA